MYTPRYVCDMLGTNCFQAKVFPRLSIDNTRRVRQLSHTVHGQVCLKSGKRTVKHMPRIVGPSLAGTYDSDRAVARDAADALSRVFTTQEKLRGVRKAFQKHILEYCRDAILHETVKTLSDERTVGAEDANATYSRVVATSLSVIGSLVNDLEAQERQKEYELYEEIFSSPQVWDFSASPDAAVRRAAYNVIRIVLLNEPDLVRSSLESISTAYVYKGLQADQTGSALEYLQTLDALTSKFPTIWTDAYTGKKPAITRLRHFLKRGTQSSPTQYWKALAELYRAVPPQIFSSNIKDAKELLEAARAGIGRREERFNASDAWPTYFTLVDLVVSIVTDDSVDELLREDLLPIVKQFLTPSPESSDWVISGSRPASIVARVATIKKLTPVLQQEWPQLGASLVELARLSQPESSKDYDRSQTQVAAAGERWSVLQRELWNLPTDELSTETETAFLATNTSVLEGSVELLRSRNGKPYGTAAIIEQQLRQCAAHLLAHPPFRDSYIQFADNDIPQYIFGPSQRQLIEGLYAASSDSRFPAIFESLLRSVLESDEPIEQRVVALRNMFVQYAPREAITASSNMLELQDFVKHNEGWARTTAGTALLADLVRLKAMDVETVDAVLTSLVSSLSIADESEASLSTIDQLARTDENAVKGLLSRSSEAGAQLLPALLRLEQSPNDAVAERASDLTARLSMAMVASDPKAKFSLVLQNVERLSEASLSIDAVLDLTRRLLAPEGSMESSEDMLPSYDSWKGALCEVLEPPRPSLAITSPFGGAVHLVHSEAKSTSKSNSYDADGFSRALRIAMYVGMLITDFDLLDHIGGRKCDMLALMHITTKVAEDNLSLAGTNSMWKQTITPDAEAALLEFVSGWNQAFDKYLKSSNAADDTILDTIDKTSKAHDSLSPLAYYGALSSAKVTEHLFEIHGSSSANSAKSEQDLKAQRTSKQFLPLLTTIVGCQQPLSGTQSLTRYCNELVADLTDLDLAANEQHGLEKLVILNSIVRTQEDAVASIAKQRLIFLVKKLTPWLESDNGIAAKAEVCKALVELLPAMADMYGEHWEQSLGFLVSFWSSSIGGPETGEVREYHILLEHASLKLMALLNKLARSDKPNDDLVDSLKEKRESLRSGLTNLLTNAGHESDEMHQPLMITNELLARQIAAMPFTPTRDFGDLYPLMYAPSQSVQHAAFDLLHQQIPAAQEQISFDAALNNKAAQLPDELLSLILEAPTLDSLVDASFDRTMPLSLQGYLFSWRLLFDHFSGSSYRVKSDYIEQLKDGTYLTDLLSFTFDFLGHSRGKPADASKFDIENYVPNTESSPERDVQWLLTHLYFLALMHMPTLVKSYYLDIRSRQTSLAVESWTAKYLSPLIIAASLKDVAEWSEKTVKDEPEYENLTVKVGMRSKEINVSYLVDEQTMSMKVVLPDAYPLASALVQGVSRVAVKEEKWQSWLRNCQGVITFSVSWQRHLHMHRSH